MLSTQFRVQQEKVQAATVKRVEQLALNVETARQERDALRARVQELRDELDQAAEEVQLGELRSQLDHVRMQAGLLSVTGPGIEVVLSDSPTPAQPGQSPNLFVLHDEDLLKVVNELRASGAEAIAINSERLVATSEIRCIGPAVVINRDRRLAPPYTITAIGDPDTMIAALEMRDGVLATLKVWGIQATIRRVPEAVVPAYTGKTTFNYAVPVFEEGGS
jgi:uncharacterized protein YlxW (UPF0749 family)